MRLGVIVGTQPYRQCQIRKAAFTERPVWSTFESFVLRDLGAIVLLESAISGPLVTPQIRDAPLQHGISE